MSTSKEMEFFNDLNFLYSAALGEVDVSAPQNDPYPMANVDTSDEEVDEYVLEKRVWKAKMKLKRLKEIRESEEMRSFHITKESQYKDQAKRKIMCMAQDGILKYMLKMMKVSSAQGFVYGFIPEKGKPKTGASDNLRQWWKDIVRFESNAAAAISKYQGHQFGKNEGFSYVDRNEGLSYVDSTPCTLMEDDIDVLEKQVWKDKMKLKSLKETRISKKEEIVDITRESKSHEQTKRIKLFRAQNGILKEMQKIMEVSKAQGFVYGIIPEKGDAVSGATDNLREWWKDEIEFDKNAPAAIADYQSATSNNSTLSEPNISTWN